MNPRLVPPPPPTQGGAATAQALNAVDMLSQRLGGSQSDGSNSAAAPTPSPAAPVPAPAPTPATTTSPKQPATETIAHRTGAMVNEIDFPGFVAGLVHGTFDAIVDASIRQMESFSGLVSAVAKTVDQFTEENVTLNQARDWLTSHYPGDVHLVLSSDPAIGPQLAPAREGLSPAWLADFDLEGNELTTELLENQLLPIVRSRTGADRQQLLATMVLLGMNRVAVKDGSISAKVMFRASAEDSAKVSYATSNDPQGVANWGERGSLSYSGGASTMVSTLGVNAQNDSSIKTDLLGEVKINFVSETLPLDRLMDQAKIALLQRNSRVAETANRGLNAPAPAAAPAPQAALPPAAAPVATPTAPAPAAVHEGRPA